MQDAAFGKEVLPIEQEIPWFDRYSLFRACRVILLLVAYINTLIASQR